MHRINVIFCILILSVTYAVTRSAVTPEVPRSKIENHSCSDGGFCQDSETCCKLKSGNDGCCPIANAHCCSDGENCCPGYSICLWGKCYLADGNITAFIVKQRNNQVCPSGQGFCTDSQTCCEVSPDVSACCPLPNASCCSDGLHCCPSGTTCDLVHQTCLRVDELTKVEPALTVKPKDTPCPGGTASCPDGNTCCLMVIGVWGCCPYDDATCCDDGIHCCPSGYTCTDSQCSASNSTVPWSTKVPSTTTVLP